MKAALVLFALSACAFLSASAVSTAAIDLGSEWLKIAIVKPGVPMEIALNNESQRKTASIVALRDGQLTYSDPALSVSTSHPNRAFRYLLDLLGRKVTHPSVQKFQSRFPFYEIVGDEERGTVVFKVGDETYTVEELVGLILKHAAENAAKFAEQPISQYVLTVPPFFNQAQRKALLNAAKLGGLKVAQLLNTNTAVAINYGIFRRSSFNETEQNILFYDMGAQSTTATIVGYSTFKEKSKSTKLTPGLVVKSVGFDAELGGLDWDFRVRDFLLQAFQKSKRSKGDITTNSRAMSKLFKEAQRIKKVLSANTDTVSQIEGLFEHIDFSTEVKRTVFENICGDLFDRAALPIHQALAAAELKPEDISQIIIVGGGPRVPKIQDILLKALGVEELGKSINGDEAAALGAAFQAAATTTGFKVQPFAIKDSALFPIEVVFDRPEDNSTELRIVHRTLYHRGNWLPQKKSLTFNKFRDAFKFQVQYEPLTFLTPEQIRYIDETQLSTVEVSGVSDAYDKHETKGKTQGVKVHFALDKSGIFHIEKSDIVFEVEQPAPSTLESIQNTLSDLYNSFTGETKPAPSCEGDDCVGTDESETDTEEKPSETPKAETPEPEKTEEKPESKEEKAEEKAEEKPEEKADSTSEEPKQTEQETEDKDSTEQQTESAGSQGETAKDNASEEKSGESSANNADSSQEQSQSDSEKKTDTETDSSNSSEKVKAAPKPPPPPPKPKSIKENLTLNPTSFTSVDFNEKTFAAANTRLQALLALEADRLANDAAKNTLETFVYNTKDKLDRKDFKAVTTAAERDELIAALDEANTWLYDEGFDASTATLKEKIAALNKTAGPIFVRHNEYTQRPIAIQNLLQSLNYTHIFLAQVRNFTQLNPNETWHNETDIKDLETLANNTISWLSEKWAEQNSTSPTQDAVLTLSALKQKTQKLDRELMYLLKKPRPKAKTTPPPPKRKAKKPKAEEETKAADDEEGKAANETKAEGEPAQQESKAEQTTTEQQPSAEETAKDQSTFDDKPKKESKPADKKKAKDEKKTAKPEKKKPAPPPPPPKKAKKSAVEEEKETIRKEKKAAREEAKQRMKNKPKSGKKVNEEAWESSESVEPNEPTEQEPEIEKVDL